MSIDFGWFLPTMGDAEIIGPPTRAAVASLGSNEVSAQCCDAQQR
jgi:hypothetical protein